MKKLVLMIAAFFAAVLPAHAADVKAEIVNAEIHAGLAIQAISLDGVHMHLHHALNCLVGPNGEGFDSKQMNPCANDGNGAIPDTANAATKAKLQSAAADASQGIADTNLASAQQEAAAADATLKAVN